MSGLTLNILPTGTVESIWSDDLVELAEQGEAVIRRVSHVEPTATGLWEADMSPVDGPILGPFRTRQEALDAEILWLQTERGL